MNTGISSPYPGAHSIEDSLGLIPQILGDDENSIISWYNINDENGDEENMASSNFEDFIDIDMAPEIHETMISSRYDDVINPDREAATLRNFSEILIGHRTIFQENCRHILNKNITEANRITMVKCKADYADSFANSVNVSCYNEGMVALLQIFNRIDDFVLPYSALIKDCHCYGHSSRHPVSQIGYALKTSGDGCKQCSIDNIITNLNSHFLTNVARARFFTVQEIITSKVVAGDEEIELGATSSNYHYDPHANDPETGWLRRWLKQYWDQEAIVAFIYNDMIYENNTHRNKVMCRYVDYYTDEVFHLTLPMETVSDEEIERRLLQEEIAYVLKSQMLTFEHKAEDFESLINHKNEQIHDMNVLGQIVGMFREQTTENFRDVSRPKGIHKIKVPNIHKHGVLIVVPLSVTIGCHNNPDML